MRRISWASSQPGQVVKFRYKGKRPGAKARLRECFILNPQHMYKRKDGKRVRLVHAVQFSAVPPKKGTRNLQTNQISMILEGLSDELLLLESGEVEALVKNPPRVTYQKVQRLLKQISSPIYRTFSWQLLQRSAVFVVDDLELTPALQSKLISFSPDPNVDESDI